MKPFAVGFGVVLGARLGWLYDTSSVLTAGQVFELLALASIATVCGLIGWGLES